MSVFDLFGDFKTKGYLQIIEGIKDFRELKVLEHPFFEANLGDPFLINNQLNFAPYA